MTSPTPLDEARELLSFLAKKSPGAFSRYIETHSTDEIRKALKLLLSSEARLREALEPFAEAAKELNSGLKDGEKAGLWSCPNAGELRRARAALLNTGEEG